jgi:uncharacterized membrane protein
MELIQFIALFLLLLVSGVFWGPWLALHRSLEVFSANELIHIVNTMAKNLAMPMRILLPACIVFMILTAWFYPQKELTGFYLSVASIILIIIALLITLLVEVPIVSQIRKWTTETIPSDWEAIRSRWVFFHAIRTFASLASFGFFAATIL